MRRNRIGFNRVMGMVLAVLVAGATCAAQADDLQTLRNVGDGYKSVKVISKYDLNADTRTMDLTAATPNDSSISRDTRVEIATETVHEICANHVIAAGWTIRIFLEGESTPAASCKAGAAKAAPHKPSKRRRQG